MNDHAFAAALAELERGGVVAAATESFFGLLADVSRQSAVERLLSLKPRGSDKGVPVLLADRASWAALVRGEIPALAERFADACWPGQLNIALAVGRDVPSGIALDGTIAVRVPGACPAAELVRRFGRPLSATSANLPGAPPRVSDAEVRAEFADAIARGALHVLPGRSPGGLPSTVVVLDGAGFRVTREAAVSRAELEAIAGRAATP
ncbi:MAG TPA: L-threonylcarbamoyladenylate synthase [Polyangiaceae bacterium]